MLAAFCNWLVATPVSLAISDGAWVIPVVQTVHILGIAMIMASILMFDLRLVGVTGRNLSKAAAARRFLPWVWGALVVMAATGTILIIGEPARELLNPIFWLKMGLLATVLVITAGIQATLRKHADDHSVMIATGLRLAAVASLILWVGIVICGRWIAYTGNS